MIVFLFQASKQYEKDATVNNLKVVAPDWTVVPLTEDPGYTMNKLLSNYAEPFFVTLHAGDRLQPEFIVELTQRCEALTDQSAGLIYGREHAQRKNKQPYNPLIVQPLLWRTDAVKMSGSPYFATKDQLPFDSYVLQDKMFELQHSYSWTNARSVYWQPGRTDCPEWKRSSEEWGLLHPILKANRRTLALNRALPLLSIVICTYNNSEYLLWSIRSVLSQTVSEWELIIIDDASTDDTPLKLESFHSDPRIRIVRNSLNKGKANCLNRALSLSTAPLLLELDADDWLPPDCVETLIQHTASAPTEVGLWYGNHYQWIERPRKELVYNGMHQASAAIHADDLLNNAYPIAPRCYRIEALHQLGGWFINCPYDGRLYEDFEMIIRLCRSYRADYIPDFLYHRRIRSSSITHSNMDKYVHWKLWMHEQKEKSGEGGILDRNPP